MGSNSSNSGIEVSGPLRSKSRAHDGYESEQEVNGSVHSSHGNPGHELPEGHLIWESWYEMPMLKYRQIAASMFTRFTEQDEGLTAAIRFDDPLTASQEHARASVQPMCTMIGHKHDWMCTKTMYTQHAPNVRMYYCMWCRVHFTVTKHIDMGYDMPGNALVIMHG